MLVYAYIYFSLRETFKNFSNDGLEAWKSSVVMGGMWALLGIEFISMARNLFKWTLPTSAPIMYIAVFSGIITVVHSALIRKIIRMKFYEKSFYLKLKKQSRFHFKVSGALFLVVIGFSVFVSYFF